jgi:hypothetical protein
MTDSLHDIPFRIIDYSSNVYFQSLSKTPFLNQKS